MPNLTPLMIETLHLWRDGQDATSEDRKANPLAADKLRHMKLLECANVRAKGERKTLRLTEAGWMKLRECGLIPLLEDEDDDPEND